MQMFERQFVRVNEWLVLLILAAMTVIVFTNVALRYLTNYSLIWAEEVARYLMIWMTFVGAGLVLRAGGHVAITNLHDLVPPPVKRALRIVVAMILLGFFAGMVWFGHDYMTRMGRQLTPATRVPFHFIYAAMPVGFALLIVHFLLVLRHYVATGGSADDRPAGGG
ncbi:TRAP transporter small permease [Hoeflea olei]|uniref:TRAP transporter small permease protein n=1 Tax=Hoeflea olei TaxID=1480615 RepID=A0A1C1YY70_9HYPH|nr:TRAP transporter small permease [Hoeflea olei]OCW58359.1 C4-dicarboxylate ABC transporter permease [Hoeflea olei]